MIHRPQEAGGLPWSSVAEPPSLASSTRAQSLHPPSPHSGLAIDGPFSAVRRGLTLNHTLLYQLDPALERPVISGQLPTMAAQKAPETP